MVRLLLRRAKRDPSLRTQVSGPSAVDFGQETDDPAETRIQDILQLQALLLYSFWLCFENKQECPT